MEKRILKIIIERIAPRQYKINVGDGITETERLFDDANAAYSGHVVLREYVALNPNTELTIHTNTNNLIYDIYEMKAGIKGRRLTQILQTTLEQHNVSIASITHVSKL